MTNQTNQEKLDEMYDMVKENNEILRSLLRREKLATFFRIVYWILILGAVFGAFIYIKPIINYITNNYSSISHFFDVLNDKASNFPEASKIKSIVESFKNQ